MDKEKIEKLIKKYDAQYETNYRNFQETGTTRYSTAYHNAEDMADALRMVLAAKDDHLKLVSCRCQISEWASAADIIKQANKKGEVKDPGRLIESILSFAQMQGLYREE